MTYLEYEKLVEDLVIFLTRQTMFDAATIGGGRKNRVYGKSGYGHQIDVSVVTDEIIVLIEAKYLNRPISVNAILVLQGRVIDIQAANAGKKVFSALVSKMTPTAGAKKLSNNFGVSLDIVENLQEYSLRLANELHIGFRSAVGVGCSIDAEVIPAEKAKGLLKV